MFNCTQKWDVFKSTHLGTITLMSHTKIHNCFPFLLSETTMVRWFK